MKILPKTFKKGGFSKRKKFHTREEITKRIDSVIKSQEALSFEADHNKSISDNAFQQSAKETDPQKVREWISEGNHARLKERNALKKLKLFPERLESLKRTLSAFDTETMPFVDKGVQLQK